MWGKHLGCCLAVLLAVLWAGEARAQTLTSGAINGTVYDEVTGDPLAGVTIIATSPAMQGEESAITDDRGYYKLSNLPVGVYLVTFYYSEVTIKRSNVFVTTNRTTPVILKLNTGQGGETIEISGKAPTVDPTSTTQGITFDQDYLKSVPVPDRDFNGALRAAAGAQGDIAGASFSGSTSLENQYIVDGVNTTGLTFGGVGTRVLNNWISELEILTGGYPAETGRSTGGVVNVVTRSGSNEFSGEVYTYFTNETLRASPERVTNFNSPFLLIPDLTYQTELGAQLGGPIVKDKLWFFVGVSPTLAENKTNKITRRRADCRVADAENNHPIDQDCTVEAAANGDDIPDVDPETGDPIFEDLGSEQIPNRSQSYPFFAKLNYAPVEGHQGWLSLLGTPSFAQNQYPLGDPATTKSETKSLTTDVALQWNSKFNDSKTEIETAVGWHRATVKSDAVSSAANNIPQQLLRFGTVGEWSKLGFESANTTLGCEDGTDNDLYPGIENCPEAAGRAYAIGGFGALLDNLEERISGRTAVIQRFDFLGNHEVKAGVGAENNRIVASRKFSGGYAINNELSNQFSQSPQIQLTRFVQLDPDATETCRTRDGDEFMCDFSPASSVEGSTFNWDAYIQDSWQILPNLSMNVGLRYEEQRLRYAEHLQGELDPLTNKTRNKNAMVLKNLWAPRLNVSYDWTKEGRSKVYAFWGRFFESIPLNLNNRSFGGETTYRQTYNPGSCGATVDGIGGPDGNECVGATTASDELLGTGLLVAPGVKAQYQDEFLIGAEYEVMEDLKVGVVYRNRRLGRILEDVSTDNATTYVIANPGEFSAEEEAKLVAEIDALPAGSAERQQLEDNLELFRGIRLFDKPRRDYHAVEVTASRRFSNDLYFQGSYTYSITEGNFPGLFSADNGQIDPNITSQFDLIELLANRDGRLPQDRPHQFKVDAYKNWQLGKWGTLRTGVRQRLLSGTPKSALSRHYLYGPNEAFVLPRGAMGRTSFVTSTDLQLGWGRNVSENVNVEVFVDFINLFNTQTQAGVDQAYTRDIANPVVGGEFSDLVFLKRQSRQGNETNQAAAYNTNFLNTGARFTPFFARLGARMTF